jgi:hypothetical protein
MTLNTGRTNERWTEIWVDNAAGTLTDLSSYLKSVGTVGHDGTVTDVTALKDAVKNMTRGIPGAPLSIQYVFDTALMAIITAYTNGMQTAGAPLALCIKYGINHAWYTGEPTFGITGTATAGYIQKDMKVDAANQTVTVTYEVFGPTLPDFATTAYT